jgi:hypothetical protein
MKTLARLIIILFLFGISGFIPKEVTAQEIIYGEFYDGLSPNGHWVNYPPYGYVWIPATYSYIPKSTNGHWVYTDDGWLWKSNYDWGKARSDTHAGILTRLMDGILYLILCGA